MRLIGLETTEYEAPTLAMVASTFTRYNSLNVPTNLITQDSTEITPKLLPLITLSQADIDRIIEQIPGGVANIQDIYGLTPFQSGVLFHHLMSKGNDSYLLINQLRFVDRISLECYANALRLVIERHDILRTVFIWDGLSEPAQVVLRQVPSFFTESMIEDEPDSDVFEHLSQQFNTYQNRIDLKKAPLLRLMTAPGFEESWIALQFIHRSIIDHSTLEKLNQEIHVIMHGRTEILETPIQFRQVVAQTRLEDNAADHERFFTEMLGDIEVPTLPFVLSEVGQSGAEINGTYLMLSQTLNDQLRKHARNLNVSLDSICHLAWAQVISKASGRDSVVFGTVLLDRLQAGKGNDSAMGPMINTLPLRLDIDERSVENAVCHTHTQLNALLNHKNAPLVLAQRCSGIPSGSTLFNSILNYRHNQKTENIKTSLPGVTFLDSIELTNYPLVMTLDDNDVDLSLSAEVVYPISAKRICAYMQQALESIANALSFTPQQQVRTLKVMPPKEEKLLLHDWNRTTIIQSPVCYLHQLFEAQVESNAKSIAVECGGVTLSYTELNIQANQLAHYLISKGVKPDDRIALCVERSTKMIVAMLGILKAGCAYVPLDPDYSSQRLTNILLDANPVLLLADAAGRAVLGKHQISVIELEKSLPTNFPTNNPNTAKLGLTEDHLAYIIYTSGSTGTPKGVMIEHQQVVRFFEAIHAEFDCNKKDKWSSVHSFSFDFSIWEIWGALSCGSQLSIVPYKMSRSTDEFYNWICMHGITVLSQTPSALKALMRAQNTTSQFNHVRFILLGGEQLDLATLNEWYKNYDTNGTIIANMYGPTETTVGATLQKFNDAENVCSIGRPLPDLCVYLLDSHGQPVLLGAEGEIYISGAGVARGYLNRPELTAERFLPDPFNKHPATRMYRTGDLARYLPDGSLMYLGRVDQQVKIRGFRIEVGEIEARLVEHSQVHEAVVQLYGSGSDARLIAYVVADADTSLAKNLRTYLLDLLPDYMVPVAYVCLPSLPLTPNGKLDRRALPAPDGEALVRQHYEAPKGEMEQKLADIWSELLSVERISRHDDFFALGGHSLLIVRVLAQLREFGLDTTVHRVYDASTLAKLASSLTRYNAVIFPLNKIREDSTKITPEMLPLITLTQTEIGRIIEQIPGGVENIQDIYGLTPLQNGMLFHYLMAKGSDIYLTGNQLSFKDRASLEHYAEALQQVIERHDILRTAFIWEGLSEPAQVVLRQIPSSLTEITLDDTEESILAQLSQRFNPRYYRLNLTQPPLLRLLAAPASDGSWKALQLMHHLIIDNSTLEMLQAELHAILNKQNEKLSIPIPFRQVVGQVRLEIQSSEHTRFFSEMLGDIDESTLAFGLADVRRDGAETSKAHLKLSQTLNDKLRIHARRLQVGLASVCHLAWAQVLAKASGREAVVFGTVLLGRLQAGKGNDSAMGPMINTLPLRLDIDEKSVEIALRDAHARMSALLAHEHAPLVLAQRCSGIPSGSTLFNSILNYRHNQKTENIKTSIPGVTFLDSIELTNYPLVMTLDDNDVDLSLSAEVVYPISAKRICAYMQQALESIANALSFTPQQQVRTLKVMPPEEEKLLLHDWNQTTIIQSPVCYLHQLFEAQVESNAQSIAVECGGVTLSYTELNIQANQLAHYLISKGVKPDDCIALCVERSTKMIVAMLGILKAGCAYVPLDPDYSSQRLTNILLDANPVLLLADAAGRAVLGKHQISVVELEKSLPTNLSIDNPDPIELGITPQNLAYVIYTSGSTGTPKGVMVEHQQIVRLFATSHYKLDFNKQDKWGLFLSICFDVPVWEIWAALSYGSQLSILPHSIARSADDFYDWICTNGITVLNPTPSAFKMLMRSKNFSSRDDRLRYVLIGGEELDPIIVKDWYEKYDKNGTTIVNMYGPTETIVQATFKRVDGLKNINSIGRPLSDLRAYLLDSFGEPVLLGAEGELYISGAGVARGYLNRPELTAERFLPDSFCGIPDTRMYRTGDRARYLPDGNLIYMGRIDHQVKIRGFRIELGEIEAQLNAHVQIKESVVLARDDCKGNKRLIAYIIFAPDTPILEPLEVRQYLQSRLPDYMIPAAFVAMDKMPITQNGKLDHKALPDPNEDAFPHQPYEAPVSELESIIADIWKSLLEVDKVGRYDHFFELGGHSLLAISAVNLVNQAVDGEIRVSDIFAAPTVKQLSHRIKSQNRTESEMIDLQKTALLPEDIKPLQTQNKSNGAILLTGATGFVGRFLLRELLDTSSQNKIYCLVRGQNQADSLRRLKKIMNKWSLWRESDEQRLIVLQGDIKMKRLGLDEQTYAKLSKDVSVIFHSAVSMNHLESFDMAHQANVAGLIELLRLATRETNKIMNFISTLNVFSTTDQKGHRVVDETSVIKNERHSVDQGYVASKWVGEEIVNTAIARDIDCNIFRLGLITADSELARYDELQAFYRLFKSSIQMGMAFDDFEGDIQLTPADFTAKALAHLGLMYNPSENIFHLSAMEQISRRDFIEQLNAHLSHPMAVVSHREWLQEARRRYQQGDILPITPLIQDMIMSNGEELDNLYKSVEEATISYDSSKTFAKLAQADITLPASSHQWYRLFAESLTR